MYIAEISPPKMRGQMVSFNQLNIVLGITVAFFATTSFYSSVNPMLPGPQALKFDGIQLALDAGV